jgi:hypothetical protein
MRRLEPAERNGRTDSTLRKISAPWLEREQNDAAMAATMKACRFSNFAKVN